MLLGTSWALRAQDLTVSGTVTGGDGAPIPGANVLLKGTTIGTVTDIDGNYRLPVPDEAGTVLSYSFIGYATIEEEVNGRSTINVSLADDVSQLSEVVVTGYGSQLKRELTGNIASVSGEELENIPVPSLEQAMQGRAAGVFIESNSGKLGQGIKVRVRGSSSVTASNQPLYVVDGIPITSQSQSDPTANSDTNPLADINFNDVESVEVLKDASAAAIYGARASNGVVLITTKKGKSGKTTFNLDAFTGFNEPTNRREFLNTQEYVELFTEAALNSGIDREVVENRFTRYGAGSEAAWQIPGEPGYIDTDWQDEIFQRGANSQVNLSANGGTEKTRFYVSGSYSDQEGIIKTNRFRRYSGRLNLDHTATEKLNFGVNFSLSRSITDRLPNDNSFSTPMQIIALQPMTPPIDPRTGELSGNYTQYYNPLIDFAYASRVTSVFRTISNVFAQYQIAPALSFRSEFGIDLLIQNEENYFGKETARNSSAPNGLGFNRWVQVGNYNTNNFFRYAPTISENHSVDAVLGMSYQESSTDESSVEGREFPSNAYKQIVSAADITDGESLETGFSFLSYFARVNYAFQDRYLLTLSGRVDGSSRFGVNNRYGFFPAAAVGWILSDEEFLVENNVLSFLKLRASYGITGNAEIGNFDALGLFTGEGGYAGVPGQRPSRIANPDLRWEQTAQFDIGFDYGLINDRLSGEVDFYVKDTRDLLLNVNVPTTTGFLTQLRNVGRLQNQGFEFVLNSSNLVGEFQWSTSLNYARNVNEITDLQGQVIEGGFLNRAVEGQPIGVFFGPEYAGVDPANGDALYYVNATDADGNIVDRSTTNNYNEANRVVIGDPNPDYTAGVTNNFSYKGIELNVFFQGVFGNQVYNGGGKFQSANGDFYDNQTRDQLARWQNPGDITTVPQARLFGANGTGESSRYLSDGSYVRLKTVTLGYSLPVALIERANLSRLRVYVSGQNLLTFTDYEGWDPEVNTDYLSEGGTAGGNISQGNDFYSAPQARTVTLGVNIGF